MKNNVWGQLIEPPTVTELDVPVTRRQSMGSELKEACSRRRPRGYRAAKVKPSRPNPDAALVRAAGACNPWNLTLHQYTAIAMMAQGAPRRAVASELGICYKTLNLHLNRVRERMGVKTVEEAVAEWLRANLDRDLEQRRQKANEMLLFRLRALGYKLP